MGLKDKGYHMAYLDLQKIIKRISGMFFVFIVGSFSLTFVEEFNQTLIKGAVLSAVAIPPIFLHFNNEDKYLFHLSRGS